MDKMFGVLTCLLGFISYALQKCLFSITIRSLETNSQDGRFYQQMVKMKMTPRDDKSVFPECRYG